MMQYNKKKGYTLVEVLLVISLIGLLMPAIFSILYVIMQQQLKIYELTETKRQGDYIMQIMKEKVLRDARTLRRDDDGIFANSAVISNVCNTSGSSFTGIHSGLDFVFLDEVNNPFQYVLVGGDSLRIRQLGSPNVDAALNSTRVNIVDFEISCYRKSDFTTPIVSFSYTAQFDRQTANPQLGVTQLRYQSKIKIR